MEYEYKYGLHDSRINKVDFKNDTLTLSFDEGAYNLDSNGRETEKTTSCKLVITLRDKNIEDISQYVTVSKTRKGRVKEISFDDLLSLLKKNYFEIDNDYYSYFNNAILLRGYIAKYSVAIEITDIQKMEFVF